MVSPHHTLAVLSLLLLPPAAFAEELEVLNDFEKTGLSNQFDAARQITLAREPIAAMAPEGGPAGHAITARTEGKSGFVTKPGGLKKSLLNASDVEMWVHRSAAEKDRGPSTIEWQFLEPDGRARFLRKVELSHAGWKKITLPLRWFLWGNGRIPRWDQIDRWGVYFRDKADLQIDDVRLVRQDDPDIALPQPEDLRQLAFPETPAEDVRIVTRGDLLLLTDETDLDTDKLVDHLTAVQKQVVADLNLPKGPPWPVPMIIFRTREEYMAFPPRLAAKLNVTTRAPQSGGFTIQGIATSYWEEKFGSVRPVYTHEFVHALLSRDISLHNRKDWLQEGLAAHYQLRFHPQVNLSKTIAEGLANPAFRLPLEDLAGGDPIPLNRYWQAATFLEMLMKDKKYQAQFPALLRTIVASDTTELGPHLKDILKTDWDTLTADWRRYCAAAYPVK